VVKTLGANSVLDINITSIPAGYFMSASVCEALECCFPQTMGQTDEGKRQVMRFSNPPAYLRLDLNTYGDAIEGESFVLHMTAHAAGHATVVCGDSLPSPSEGCDDGNDANGDGCSSECNVEDNFMCKGGLKAEVVIDDEASGKSQIITIIGGPMLCKEMCTSDDPCADCTSFDSGFGVCADYAKDGTLHAFCNEDRDEFGVLAADACSVSCSTSFILLCNANNRSVTFDTLETKTEIIAATTAIEAGAFPIGSALKSVRHKYPSSSQRSTKKQEYRLEALEDVWKDAIIASDMNAPPLPNRNAGIERTVLNNDITGKTVLARDSSNHQLTAEGQYSFVSKCVYVSPSFALSLFRSLLPETACFSAVTMAVDPCKLRAAAGCAHVSRYRDIYQITSNYEGVLSRERMRYNQH